MIFIHSNLGIVSVEAIPGDSVAVLHTVVQTGPTERVGAREHRPTTYATASFDDLLETRHGLYNYAHPSIRQRIETVPGTYDLHHDDNGGWILYDKHGAVQLN